MHIYIYIYICIYMHVLVYIHINKQVLRLNRTGRLQTASAALENTAQAQLFRLSARNHCSNVLRSHWAFEITARACFLERLKATERSKSVLEHASFSFEATERSKSLLERAP